MLTQRKSHRQTTTLVRPGQFVRTSVATYLVILVSAVCWCVALLFPPLLLAAGGGWREAGFVLYQPFHSICHQLTGRSFTMFGAPLAVCIRCSAIYFGFLFGTLLYLPLRPHIASMVQKRWPLIFSVFPMIVDVVLDMLGVHASTGATRLITGMLFGVVVPFYIIPAAQEAMHELLTASRFFAHADIKKGSIHA
jgi:uncharacterized membrane protein